MPKEMNFNSVYDDVINAMKASGRPAPFVSAVCGDLERSKVPMMRCYSGINSSVKFDYMKISEGRLDRHKCAAAFMVATLNGLKLEKCAVIAQNEFLLEDIAIHIGLIILRTFICFDSKNHKNAGIIAFLNESKGFVFPEPICDSKPYIKNWALELYYARKAEALFVLSLSDKLFLLESYNRALAEMRGDRP
jgi:hypothetical protein